MRVRELLQEAGLHASVLVRDLETGREAGLEPDARFPCASLVKVPLALVTSLRIDRGEIDPAARVTLRPLGFRHEARVAVDDLLELALTVSDNAAADALFDLTPPDAVDRELRALGLDGISVRHRMADLSATPALGFAAPDRPLGHLLAEGSGSTMEQFDVSRANAGSVRAFANLLQELWRPVRVPERVASRVRELLAGNVFRQRLAPDFASDHSRWSSKTGTLLTLRHEVGVVEHTDGGSFVVAVMSRSIVPATQQPDAESTLGQVARLLHDDLRAEL